MEHRTQRAKRNLDATLELTDDNLCFVLHIHVQRLTERAQQQRTKTIRRWLPSPSSVVRNALLSALSSAPVNEQVALLGFSFVVGSVLSQCLIAKIDATPALGANNKLKI